MRYRYMAVLTFAAAFPCICFSQDDALQACVDIYKNSTRDYSQSQQTNIELARSFNSFCKKDGSVNTSATGVGLDAVIQSIPFKFAFNNTNSQQKMEEFCKVGSSQYDSWNLGSASSSTVNTDSLSNFNNCIALANSGLHIKVAISQPNTLVVSGYASGGYSGFINTVAYDGSAMSCRSSDFNPSHKPAPINGPVHLSTQNPFAITCTKTPQAQSNGAIFYQRATLTIAAGAVSPLAIVFPSDTLNGYELASQAAVAVSQAASQVTQAQTAAATQKQIADSLQNRINGTTVSVYARDLVLDNCFGTGANWGAGFGQEVANTCGSRPHATATSHLRPGGTCGQAAVAYACVNIPQ